jgi:hypothetical protein
MALSFRNFMNVKQNTNSTVLLKIEKARKVTLQNSYVNYKEGNLEKPFTDKDLDEAFNFTIWGETLDIPDAFEAYVWKEQICCVRSGLEGR